MRKDTDEQPGEEIHRARPGRALSAGASVPVERGCVAFLVHEYAHQPESSLKAVLQVILWSLPHVDVIDY